MELGQEHPQRVGGAYLLGSEGPEKEEGRIPSGTRKVVQDLEAGFVRGVQVVEDEYHRCTGRQAPEKAGHRGEEAEAVRQRVRQPVRAELGGEGGTSRTSSGTASPDSARPSSGRIGPAKPSSASTKGPYGSCFSCS